MTNSLVTVYNVAIVNEGDPGKAGLPMGLPKRSLLENERRRSLLDLL